MKKIISFIIAITVCYNVFAVSFYKPSITIAPMLIKGANIYEVTGTTNYNLGYSINTEHGYLNITKNKHGWFYGIGTGIDFITTISEKYNGYWTGNNNEPINTYLRNSVICIPAYLTGQYIHNINKVSFTCKVNAGYYGFVYAWDSNRYFDYNKGVHKIETIRNYGPYCSNILIGGEIGTRIPLTKSYKYGLTLTYAYNTIIIPNNISFSSAKMSLNIKFDF